MEKLDSSKYIFNLEKDRGLVREDIKGLILNVRRVHGKVAIGFMLREDNISDKEVIQWMYPKIESMSFSRSCFITELDYSSGSDEYVNYSNEYLRDVAVTIVINNMYKVRVELKNDKFQIDKVYQVVIERLRTVTDEIDKRLASEPDINYKIPIVSNSRGVTQ